MYVGRPVVGIPQTVCYCMHLWARIFAKSSLRWHHDVQWPHARQGLGADSQRMAPGSHDLITAFCPLKNHVAAPQSIGDDSLGIITLDLDPDLHFEPAQVMI